MADSPEMDASDVVRMSILSDGAELDDSFEILSIEIIKEVNRVPTAKIVLRDGDMPNKDFPVSSGDTMNPGAEIEIKVGYDDSDNTVFKGIIVRHGIKISGDNYSRLVIECKDKSVAMTVGRKNANYVDSTDSDIISTLIGNYSSLDSDVESTSLSNKELVQYYCTDWDFMMTRAEVNGLLVIADDGKVSVKAPETSAASVLKVTYGEDLMEFHADLDARTQLSAVKGTSWDSSSQAIVEGSDAGPAELNEQGDDTSASAKLAEVIGLESFRLQTPVPLEKTALDGWAEAQQLKAGLARIQGSMRFQGSSLAKVGTLIDVDGVGKHFNGSVFVTAVHHEILNGNWITTADFGMSPEWFAEKNNLESPPTSGLLPGVEGLHIGVVKKLDEDPDGQNRIQVAVPVLQAETEGVWARLSNFYASEGIGSFFIPEIGDEVVLGYFNNDPSYPVILGSLYSSSRQPPYSLTADNFIKAIITNSELTIEFDDDKKVITISTPAGNQVVISDEDKSILLQDENDNKVELGSDGILLDSPKDISITAKGKITLDAGGALSISSEADVAIDGNNINSNAKIGVVSKGSASAELSASGQTTVKGAIVMIN